MDVMERARAAEAAGRRIIHMEVGQPGTPGARRCAGGAGRALDGPLGYTVALGLPELRAGIAGLYRRWYGVDLDPARVVVTTGSSSAFLLAFTALFDAGDRVAWASRAIPAIARSCAHCRCSRSAFPRAMENRLQPVVEDLDGLDVAGLIVASPATPPARCWTAPRWRG
jgi:aspartate/methionine/tyrosine aminotransferase